jgi:hypothetical protein
MSRVLPCRVSQRGNVMLVVLLALVGLAAIGGITALSVTRGGHATTHARFKSIALYAAESGAAAAMDFLRHANALGTSWSTFVTSSNDSPLSPTGIVGNMVAPGEDGNPFSEDEQAWYEVTLLNDASDPQYAAGEDADHRLIIRATGHGPDGAVARIEWEIQSNVTGAAAPHCPAYGQRGMAEDDAGRNDCLLQIDSTQTGTYSPGGH